jgi:hypothetical protein
MIPYLFPVLFPLISVLMPSCPGCHGQFNSVSAHKRHCKGLGTVTTSLLRKQKQDYNALRQRRELRVPEAPADENIAIDYAIDDGPALLPGPVSTPTHFSMLRMIDSCILGSSEGPNTSSPTEAIRPPRSTQTSSKTFQR